MFQILKALAQGFFEIGKSLWRSFGRKVRIGLAVVLALIVAAFCIKRYRDSFTDQPPEWLKQREMSGPSLPGAMTTEFAKSIELAQRYADQRGVPFGSVRLVEIEPEITNVVIWATDIFSNAGFNPLRSYERSMRADKSTFIGYYTREGKPLDITLKHTPTRPKDLLMTVHLKEPIAPGASAIVYRLERHLDRVKPTKEGKYQYGLGRMPPASAAIHIWEIQLPRSGQLVRHDPETGASLGGERSPRVTWNNAMVDPSAPPISVIFTLTK